MLSDSFILRAVLVAVVIGVGHSTATAETLLWNQSMPGGVGVCEKENGLCSVIPWDIASGFSNPSFTVEYRTRIENRDTGTLVTCGSSIPKGTRLRLSFEPHVYSDIRWFAMGSWYDSPYGTWGNTQSPPPVTCEPKDFLESHSNPWGGLVKMYATFVVNPPDKEIRGLENTALDCGSLTAASVDCVAARTGSLTPQFNLEETFGSFFSRIIASAGPEAGNCTGSSIPMLYRPDMQWPGGARSWYDFTGIYRVSSGAQYVNGTHTPLPSGVPFTTKFVVPNRTLTCPITITDSPLTSTPTAPTVTTLGGNNACSIDTPHTLQMVATDPDGGRIRYGIDWDNNGGIDQFVPATGYVASGVAQSASRTFITEGANTIRVFTQDEGGLISAGTSYTFTCTPAPTIAPPADDGFSGFNDETPFTGDGGGVIDGALRVIPSLVRQGEPTRVHWSTENVDNCTVTAPNGDEWRADQSVVGGYTSRPITQRTLYTLRCRAPGGGEYIRTAVVNILPLWREF